MIINNEHEFELSNIEFQSFGYDRRRNELIFSMLWPVMLQSFFGAEPALVSRERHRHALEDAQTALDRALAEGPAGREDIIAEELRLAARALGRLTGRVDVEDILDVIFRDFCIGK